MRRLKNIKILLFIYLSFTFLLPSYYEHNEGREFHFLEALEPYIEGRHHSRPEIEAPHDRNNNFVLHFYPSRRIQRLSQNYGKEISEFIVTDDSSTYKYISEDYDIIPFHPYIALQNIYEKQTSGLSPPLA